MPHRLWSFSPVNTEVVCALVLNLPIPQRKSHLFALPLPTFPLNFILYRIHCYPPSSSTSTPASHPLGKFGSYSHPSIADRATVHPSTQRAARIVRIASAENRRCCTDVCIVDCLACCCKVWSVSWIEFECDADGDGCDDVSGGRRPAAEVDRPERYDLGTWLSILNLMMKRRVCVGLGCVVVLAEGERCFYWVKK